MQLFKKIVLSIFLLLWCTFSQAQLLISSTDNATLLAQQLVGNGVTISNATFTGNRFMAGLFNNLGGNNIGIDSGIVLTNGIAASTVFPTVTIGVNGDGITPAINANAHKEWFSQGDADLSILLNGAQTNDACVLEFDFVPLGDSIKFKYVFSSEEYPEYACGGFNDAFAFFISGPGILGLKNIALVPGTNLPVTIDNINDVLNCGLFPQYYIDNATNTLFTHNGHTTVLTALERVRPCQTYHLKLVIADVGDADFDSGVFLEAKSLSSTPVRLSNQTQTDPQGNSYIVEGCTAGSFKVKRPVADPSPLDISLIFGGNVVNGVDVQLIPSVVTIPANQAEIVVDVIPIVDNTPEGIEQLKIYALPGSACAVTSVTDSAVIQIRDYDILGITPDTARICKGTALPLIASAGYATYQWEANTTLSSTVIRTPIATPVDSATKYICTANIGTCNAKDSSYIVLKLLDFVSKQDVNCRNGTTGQIKVKAGGEWSYPIEFSINNAAYQPDSTFNNLPVGNYRIKVRDAVGCMDSVNIVLVQTYPDLLINSINISPAGCSGLPDGSITVNAAGGLSPYTFSNDNINYQSSNVFAVIQGNYPITLKDVNGCIITQNVVVPLNDTVFVDAGKDSTICEGKIAQLTATSNGNTLLWFPSTALSSTSTLVTKANPTVTTKYYLQSSVGICVHIDSATVFVNPAPMANAGADKVACYGDDIQLNGSGGVDFIWRPSVFLNNAYIANPTSSVKATFAYKLWVKNALGCESLQPDEVNIKVVPPVKIFAGNDTTVSIRQPLQLNVIETSRSGVSNYIWSPSTGLNNPFSNNPIAVLDRDITYNIVGTTPEGCVATDEIKVRVIKGPDIYVPNTFTPNGDGLNDVLKAIPVGIKQFNYFTVYDRWGKLVFTTSNPLRGWDGKINGSLQLLSSFVWMAEGIDYKGNLIQRKGSTIIMQ
ncbi:MAG: choice-of-anchor L domain-containing protein [Ferruginibacter sp.]|nr:choice-of-anchor L domain-containing protein [Ferruginibacter sp.]